MLCRDLLVATVEGKRTRLGKGLRTVGHMESVLLKFLHVGSQSSV